MTALSSDLFDYVLPPERIAQHPAQRRDGSRLMVVDRATRTVRHRRFSDLPEFLRAGDILVRNNAAVLPARLHLRRPTGGQVECLLLAPVGSSRPILADGVGRGTAGETWRCLIRPGRRLPVGARISDEAGELEAEVVAKDEEGVATVRFRCRSGESVASVATRLGEVPLPPYLERAQEGDRAEDRERYQTVYADRRRSVAVAAPTAGLHFTDALLESLAAAGVRTADVTLHVGLGTFKPISAATIQEHVIHREIYDIPAATQAILRAPGAGRRIAVGTTAVRAMEDFLARTATGAGTQGPTAPGGPGSEGAIRPGFEEPGSPADGLRAEAGLFIHPPRAFRGVDALITNFHLPRSTLLCLVAAFLAPGSTDGIAWLAELYAEALRGEYRFLSYGDAMLIL